MTWFLWLLAIVLGAVVTASSVTAKPTLHNEAIRMEHWPPYYRPLEAYLWSGVSIHWVNTTASSHTVRHDDCVTGNVCAFDSGAVGPGQPYVLPGLPPGRYPYHCALHPIMGGTLLVEESAGRT